MPASHKDDLELGEDRAFQERWWQAQRVAWLGFALIVALAIAGLTGSGGVFADATASGAAGSIDYPRITRWQADDAVEVQLQPSSASQRTLTLSRDFVELFQIVDVEPRPIASTATAEGVDLTLAARPGEAGTVTLKLRALHPGIIGYYAAIDGERLNATTVALP
jgi:hypothetical protein